MGLLDDLIQRIKTDEALSERVKAHCEMQIVKARPGNRRRAAKYRAEHPEEARIRNQKRRARTTGIRGTLSEIEWQWILLRHDYKCAKCGAGGKMEMDHIVPLSKGGEHSAKNIQPLCLSCNRNKGTKTSDHRSNKEKKMFGV